MLRYPAHFAFQVSARFTGPPCRQHDTNCHNCYDCGVTTLTVSPSVSDEAVLSFVRSRLAAGERVQITATEPFLTPQEVSESLGVSRPFIMKKLKAGELISTRRGNRHRISVGELDRFRAQMVSDHGALVAADVEAELFPVE